jgi:hypothetical protein
MKIRTLKDLSAEKNIPVSTLRNFIREGMPHFRTGRKIYVSPDEFDSWFDTRFRVVNDKQSQDLDSLINETLATFG